jgi:predicted transcriptional regulator
MGGASETARLGAPLSTEIRAVFPIQPHWVRLIASGVKRLEFRRKWPRLKAPYRAVVYASGPISAIVGLMDISQVHTGPPSYMCELLASFGGPESADEIREYFARVHEGAALEIARYITLERPLQLQELRRMSFRPPQSFVYLDTYPELKAWLQGSDFHAPSAQEELDLFSSLWRNSSP